MLAAAWARRSEISTQVTALRVRERSQFGDSGEDNGISTGCVPMGHHVEIMQVALQQRVLSLGEEGTTGAPAIGADGQLT